MSWLARAMMWRSLWLAVCVAVLATLVVVASPKSDGGRASRQPTRWLWTDRSIAVSPNGQWLAVHVATNFVWRMSRAWGAVWLLNLVSGQAGILESGFAFSVKQGGLDCVAFSPDSKVLAVCGLAEEYPGGPVSDYAVQLWDVSVAKELPGLMPRRVAKSGTNQIGYVAFSPDGNYLAAAPWWELSLTPAFLHGSDNMIHLWQWPTAEPVQLLTSYHAAILFGLAFSPDSVHLAVAVHKHLFGKTYISLLDVEERKEVHRFECEGNCGQPVFSSDGKTLAAITWHGMRAFARQFLIRFWDVDTGEKQADVPSAAWAAWRSAIFAPGGHTLAVNEPDDTIAFWDAPSGREMRRLAFPEGVPMAFVFTPDGKAIIGGGAETTPVVHMWNANTGKELQHWDLSGLLPEKMKVGKREQTP